MNSLIPTYKKKIRTHIYSWLLSLLLLFPHSGIGQHTYDTSRTQNKHRTPAKTFIVPAALIGVGIFTWTNNGLIDRKGVRKFRNTHFPSFSSTADDYLQYVPGIIALSLKALGVTSEHDWPATLDLLIRSQVLTGFIVTQLKYATQVPRPNSKTLNSFPSGHTAQAFSLATFLHKEFGKKHPWLSVVGYTIASCVGIMRILRDRHWISDVLVGAGVGILLTNVVYLSKKSGKKSKPNKHIRR